MRFAGEKHFDQKVPGTQANYLLHISNVAMEVLIAHQHSPEFDIDFAVQVAILHDTIEDTSADFTEIQHEFGEQIALAVQALTKNEKLPTKEERMRDSLDRIKQLPKEVAIVKIADRITNLQSPPQHWSVEKITQYREEAKLIASSLKGKNAYLNDRLEQKIVAYEAYTNKP